MRRRRRHRLPHDLVRAFEFCEIKHFSILSHARHPREGVWCREIGWMESV
jgi:hypothetical protein